MGQNSAIEWTHHTFNPWRGCTKVSDGCKHCYAETMSSRNPAVLGVWGPRGARVVAAESYWRQPIKWNAEAERAGERRRVFCASLADVFEAAETMPDREWAKVDRARSRLFELIATTPGLDWLLLTKRPQHIANNIPRAWMENGLPSNIWIGTSVENQAAADERIPELLKVPARVRFLSCEPLLGPVDLEAVKMPGRMDGETVSALGMIEHADYSGFTYDCIDWVIVGGESGHGARPMHPDWARQLRDQAQAADVAFFFKQHGEYIHETQIWHYPLAPDSPVICTDAWTALVLGKQEPADRGWQHEDRSISYRVGKKAAGRLLDGREWNEFPNIPEVSTKGV